MAELKSITFTQNCELPPGATIELMHMGEGFGGTDTVVPRNPDGTWTTGAGSYYVRVSQPPGSGMLTTITLEPA